MEKPNGTLPDFRSRITRIPDDWDAECIEQQDDAFEKDDDGDATTEVATAAEVVSGGMMITFFLMMSHATTLHALFIADAEVHGNVWWEEKSPHAL